MEIQNGKYTGYSPYKGLYSKSIHSSIYYCFDCKHDVKESSTKEHEKTKEHIKNVINCNNNIFINNTQQQLDKDNKDLNDAKEFLRYLDDPYMYDMENVIFDDFNMIKKFEYIMCKNGLDFLLVVEDGEFEIYNQYKFKTIKEQRKADKLFEKYCI